MKSTRLDSGFFDEPSTEPLGAFRPPSLASMRRLERQSWGQIQRLALCSSRRQFLCGNTGSGAAAMIREQRPRCQYDFRWAAFFQGAVEESLVTFRLRSPLRKPRHREEVAQEDLQVKFDGPSFKGGFIS